MAVCVSVAGVAGVINENGVMWRLMYVNGNVNIAIPLIASGGSFWLATGFSQQLWLQLAIVFNSS
jgi:hypothetical protein